jgi:RibD C-terminal domain
MSASSGRDVTAARRGPARSSSPGEATGREWGEVAGPLRGAGGRRPGWPLVAMVPGAADRHLVKSYGTLQEPASSGPTWTNSTVLGGDVVEEVAKLRPCRAGDIVVHGSAQLVQTLVEHDLIDEVGVQIP